MTNATPDGTLTRPFDVSRLLAEEDWLQRLSLHLLHDGHDADDLRQETMLAALRRAPQGRHSASLL